jgi:glutamine phosphoribosylpyrophosphate amidotransferase
MCEILMLASPEPFALGQALAAAARLEQDGKAGHGWGVAWVQSPGGPVQIVKQPREISGDTVAESLRHEMAVAVLIHLRMPSDISTVGMPDTQPFRDSSGDTAFAHNGYLPQHDAWRERYAAELIGRADSEVGWRHFCRHLSNQGLEGALRRVTDEVGGPEGFANLAVVDARGGIHMLCMNNRNRVCELHDGALMGFTTTVHRDDESGLHAIFPRATLSLLPVGSYASITPQSAAV